MADPRTTLRAVAEARFGALLLDAIEGTGIERAFCDCADTLLGDAMSGAFPDGVEDGLIAGGTSGCASSDLTNGEI